MAVRECRVTFDDSRGVLQSTTVYAESVLEAAAAGLKQIRETEKISDDGVLALPVDLATTTSRPPRPIPRNNADLAPPPVLQTPPESPKNQPKPPLDVFLASTKCSPSPATCDNGVSPRINDQHLHP